MTKNDLADILVESLNKKNKDQKIAFFLDDDSDGAPTNVNGWISTGAAMLDVAISNRPYGGIPVGRITEITGLEQSGKSLLSAHILAETQKQGGVAVLIDTETAVSREFFDAIGVDVSKLLYVSVDTVEDIFETIETIIEKVRTSDKDRLATIGSFTYAPINFWSFAPSFIPPCSRIESNILSESSFLILFGATKPLCFRKHNNAPSNERDVKNTSS